MGESGGRGPVIDISPPLNPEIAVFPGDTPLSREVLLDFSRGDSLTLSTLHGTVHLGAHVDAPLHYAQSGASIDQLPLELFVGRCRVIRTPATPRARVSWEAVSKALDDAEPTERLLLATGSYPDPTRFEDGFAALDPEAVRRLGAKGVRLLGVDTPSVDPADSKDLPAHEACRETGITILEGLALDRVPDGLYELIALPLRLVGFDASPVRAVLRPIS
ncbi:MAG: cyclase family protein [marine benthic group bacterium]|jgi:arylformamidase|nr:cyclase family protein [Candidatus Carthagonibacter metallireducens]MCL7969544.1 cyclase family protein [Gemmatimonadota bacterium]MCL7990342.1 cyclase family protein [Gemmatimonadota bacterium]